MSRGRIAPLDSCQREKTQLSEKKLRIRAVFSFQYVVI